MLIAWIRKEYGQIIKDGFVSACIGYAVLVGVSIVKTIYDDHQNVVKRWQGVVNEKNSLKQGLETRDQYIQRLEVEINDLKKAPPKVTPPKTVYVPVGKDAEETKRRAAIRTQLGYLITEGRNLMMSCLSPQDAKFSCSGAVAQWNMKSLRYIRENMEPSYASRFFSATGLSMIWSEASPEINKLLQFLKDHTDILEQFIKEFLN